MKYKLKLLLSLFFIINTGLTVNLWAIEIQDITDQTSLNKAVLEEFSSIVTEYNKILNQASHTTTGNGLIKLLQKGFWYPVDYYDFLSRDELKNNKAVLARLTWMKEHNSFNLGMTTSDELTLVGDLQNKILMSYNLKDKVAPSTAILNIGKQVILIDCAIAYQLAFYRAALKLLGEENFNKLFSSLLGYFLSTNTEKTKLKYFIKFIDRTKPCIGAVGRISNHPFYQYKNLYGEGRGFNLMVKEIDQDETLYLGFGLSSDGLTAEEVKAHLVLLFNQLPYNKAWVSHMVWENRDGKDNLPNNFMMDYLANINIESVDDQNILIDLAKEFQRKFDNMYTSQAIEGFIKHLKEKFNSSADLNYFLLDFEELLAKAAGIKSPF